ncbi:membrane protease subunit, stomatin/prohibitin [bacterium]|nr:membrane protease subunit, stomatin/prohibitin [bacterium]
MKIVPYLFLALFGLVVGWELVNASFWLFNQPSTLANIAGHFALLATGVGGFLGGRWVWKRAKGTSTDGASSLIVLVVAGAASTQLAGCTTIEPGHVGVVINMNGDSRGVEDIPVTTGRVWYNPVTENVYMYPTFVQTAVWTKDLGEGHPSNEEFSFASKEGLIINADVSISYQIDAAKIPAFYVKFRNDDIEAFTHGFLHNSARDALNETASEYGVEDIYGPGKEAFLAKVRERLAAQVADIGVSIQQLGFTGALRVPDTVTEAINAKITATQTAIQRENELRKTEAEAAMAVAKAEGDAKAKIAEARGIAESNDLITKSLSHELILYQAVQKWDGKRPTVEGAGSGLIISLPPDTK